MSGAEESHGNSGPLAGVDPDFPMTSEGFTYHIPCRSEDMADRIILVGDPGRVKVVGAHLDPNSIVYSASHREINIITGKYRSVPVTVLSTGMGTDNIEIVMNEVHILKEYNMQKRQWRIRIGGTPEDLQETPFDPSKVKLIRVGTCGSPNEEVPVGGLAITEYAVGMDNTCQYYDNPEVNSTADVQEVLAKLHSTSLGKMKVYATKATPALTRALVDACEDFNSKADVSEQQSYYIGATCSGSGFYGCQGRPIGHFTGHLTIPHLTEELGDLRFNVSEGVRRVANIEMECSALCYLSNLLGYQAGAVCVVVARRSRTGRAFATQEQTTKRLSNAIKIALEALTKE